MGYHRRITTFSQRLRHLVLALMALCAANMLRAEDVRQGMRRDEILASWGKPCASITQANREIISYGDGREVHLVDGVARSVLNPNAITATPALQPVPASLPLVSRFNPALREQLAAKIPAFTLPEILPKKFYGRLPAGVVNAWPLIMPVFVLLLVVVQVIAIWKVYTAANEPGWAMLVPIYSTIVLLRIADKPIWWLLLLCLPVVNILTWLLVSTGVARNFGRSVGFGLGLMLFPFVFYPILAFSRSR